MNVDFREEQRFTQWWLWLILIGIGVLPVFGIYKQLILREPFGERPMSDFGLVVFSLLIFALIGLFVLMKLKTEINRDEIRMTFVPFVKKRVKWNEIREAKVLDYGFVGGWGIRYSTRYGRIYNIQGRKGLAIELKNGKKFLIGTQKDKELEEMIQKVGSATGRLTSPKAATS